MAFKSNIDCAKCMKAAKKLKMAVATRAGTLWYLTSRAEVAATWEMPKKIPTLTLKSS